MGRSGSGHRGVLTGAATCLARRYRYRLSAFALDERTSARLVCSSAANQVLQACQHRFQCASCCGFALFFRTLWHFARKQSSVYGGLPSDGNARALAPVVRRSSAISAHVIIRELAMSPKFVRRPSRNGRSAGFENLYWFRCRPTAWPKTR